jgi:myo-inositol 2-dehydrogenase / D-chiro-inositol 1-dehydrogenase
MRIGLIGVGRIGVFHASTLRGLPGVDTLIITDADLDRARQVTGEFGARTAGSVTEASELSRHRQQPVLVAEVRR